MLDHTFFRGFQSHCKQILTIRKCAHTQSHTFSHRHRLHCQCSRSRQGTGALAVPQAACDDDQSEKAQSEAKRRCILQHHHPRPAALNRCGTCSGMPPRVAVAPFFTRMRVMRRGCVVVSSAPQATPAPLFPRSRCRFLGVNVSRRGRRCRPPWRGRVKGPNRDLAVPDGGIGWSLVAVVPSTGRVVASTR